MVGIQLKQHQCLSYCISYTYFPLMLLISLMKYYTELFLIFLFSSLFLMEVFLPIIIIICTTTIEGKIETLLSVLYLLSFSFLTPIIDVTFR